MRRFIFILFSLLLLCNGIVWSGLHLGLVALGAGALARTLLALFIASQGVGVLWLIGARLLGGQPGQGMGRPYIAWTMLWNLLVLIPATAGVAMWALLYATAPGWLAVVPRAVGWGAILAGPVLTALGTLVSLFQLRRFRVARIEISLPGLSAALDGLSIAHVSDLHVGLLTTGSVLDRAVERVNRLDADLVLFTGDLVNSSLDDLPRALDVLSRMRARHGLYACEGNHDLIEDGPAFERRAKEAGLRLLCNETATVTVRGEAVRVIGLRWGEGHGPGAEGAVLRRLLAEGEGIPIVLAHHPDAFAATAAQGVPLTLSGHTHGGQINVGRLGFGARLYRRWSGLYAEGASRLVVSNGTGNWFPLRINAPAEVLHLVLRSV